MRKYCTWSLTYYYYYTLTKLRQKKSMRWNPISDSRFSRLLDETARVSSLNRNDGVDIKLEIMINIWNNIMMVN